jgi:hypothetical protein
MDAFGLGLDLIMKRLDASLRGILNTLERKPLEIEATLLWAI